MNQQVSDELSRIDALIAQHDVSKALPEPERGPGGRRPGGRFNPDVPPPWYRCYRCGQSTHFVQACPTVVTLEDQALLKNVRQARGIPRAFLQKATEEDLKRLGTGGYLTATGELMMLRQVSEEEKARIVGESENVKVKKFFGESQWEIQKEILSCPICASLFKDAVVTPCCSSVFCKECLMKHLEQSFSFYKEEDSNRPNNRQCPACPAIVHIDQVVPDIRLQNLVAQIVYGELAVIKTTAASFSSPPPQAVQPTVPAGRPQPKKPKLDISVSLAPADTDEVEVVKEPAARFHGLIKVAAGPLNPFFTTDGKKLTKDEFTRWQANYTDALVTNGFLDKVMHKQKLLKAAADKNTPNP